MDAMENQVKVAHEHISHEHAPQESSRSPFNPERVNFQPVSEALIKVRVWSTLVTFVILIGGSLIPAFLVNWYFLIVSGVLLLLVAWVLWLIPRQVRAMAWAEGEQEFIIRKGVVFKSLTLIPYGRIQYVDINEGPIARKFGIARITLHTASSQTSGDLEGLPVAEAARLRDHLAHKGSTDLVGM